MVSVSTKARAESEEASRPRWPRASMSTAIYGPLHANTVYQNFKIKIFLSSPMSERHPCHGDNVGLWS